MRGRWCGRSIQRINSDLPGVGGSQIDSDDGADVLVLLLLILGQREADAEGHDGQHW